jgi:hypothetical protein
MPEITMYQCSRCGRVMHLTSVESHEAECLNDHKERQRREAAYRERRAKYVKAACIWARQSDAVLLLVREGHHCEVGILFKDYIKRNGWNFSTPDDREKLYEDMVQAAKEAANDPTR